MDEKRFESKYPPDSRFSEVERIFSFVKAGKSAQVVGLPGVGRSQILGLLSFNKNVRIAHVGQNEEKEFHFVLINFSEIKGKPLSEVTKFIFLSLIDSLRLRDILKDSDSKKELEISSSIFKNSLASGDNLVIFNALKRNIDFLCTEKGLSIIFLFDRFEEYVGSLDEEFFINLRSLRDQAKYKFSVLFSLKTPIEEILEPEIYEPFYEFFQSNIIYLPIEDKPGLKFRIEYLEKTTGVKFPKDVVDKTIVLTGGHGKLTRACLESYEENGDLTKFYLSKNAVRSTLSEIWKSFTPQEQNYLKNKGTDTPQYLLNVRIISEGKITIPLFEEYIKSIETKEEKFVFDLQRNEITKGEFLISTGLTKMEFKFLKFLIEKEGQVLERDQIIDAVWGEQKSTAGVTDQALDQLLFRLRKKIEENPNFPKHILSVKGRGIEFRQ